MYHVMANRWENNANSERLFSWAPKSLQMVTAAMKRQGSLVCCNPWGCNKLDRTEQLNNNLQSITSEEKDIYNNDSNRNYFVWTRL